MWILIQNGNRILTTDGMDEIYISPPAVGKTDYAVMMFRKRDGKPFALGFYGLKKRATKSLEEIFETQAEYICQRELGNVIIPPKVYRMLPDEEMAFMKEFVMKEVIKV